MIVGIDELLRLVKEKNLVENLSERELKTPEGAGFDLRIGEIYSIDGHGFLGVDERSTADSKLLAKIGRDKNFILKPGDFVLMKTIEKVNLPNDLLMLTFPRSTLYRSGVLFLATQCAPSYSGEMVYALKNVGNVNFQLELGARIVHVVFLKISGKGSPYRGQWQGGRVTTNGKEKQI